MTLALALLLGAAAEDAAPQEEANTYIAVAQWDPMWAQSMGFDDADRIIFSSLIGYPAVATRLPEDAPEAETFALTGIRLVFDEPVEAMLEENAAEAVLEPLSVEIIGKVRYGRITEMGEDYILHDVYANDQNPELKGDAQRFTLTEDTVMWSEEPFGVNSGCEIIIDDDGVVLAMIEGNG